MSEQDREGEQSKRLRCENPKKIYIKARKVFFGEKHALTLMAGVYSNNNGQILSSMPFAHHV